MTNISMGSRIGGDSIAAIAVGAAAINIDITEWENQACITGNTSKAIFHQKLMEGARMGRWGPKELIHLHMQLVQLAGFQVAQNWCGDPWKFGK